MKTKRTSWAARPFCEPINRAMNPDDPFTTHQAVQAVWDALPTVKGRFERMAGKRGQWSVWPDDDSKPCLPYGLRVAAFVLEDYRAGTVGADSVLTQLWKQYQGIESSASVMLDDLGYLLRRQTLNRREVVCQD